MKPWRITRFVTKTRLTGLQMIMNRNGVKIFVEGHVAGKYDPTGHMLESVLDQTEQRRLGI